MPGPRLLGVALAVAGTLVAAAAVAGTTTALLRTPSATVAVRDRAPVLGAYTGAAANGVEALRRWEDWTGVAAPLAIDFAAADSWANIDGPGWLLGPWRDAGRRLIYSLPLFPSTVPDTRAALRDCAAGRFDVHWDKVGRQLVTYGLPSTIMRPGWEFNGDWYGWSAAGHETAYIGCFRHVVTAMRAVPGQRFEFLWNPSLGDHGSAATSAYPGDEYVDHVGVDVYDTSWRSGTYPPPKNPKARAAVYADTWDTILDGPQGLRAWARFAAEHGKFLAVPEWGLSTRTDGHGGGDNVAFVERMLAFVDDPAHHVAFALYFDADAATGKDRHRVAAADSAFPAARARFQELLHARRISR